jgi:RNA-binding motif X-linked protein 2
MNNIREIEKINAQELERGLAGTAGSWHSQFAHAPWVYVGNLDHQLTEGDILCILSQYGEIEDAHLIRDEETGKSKGFGFVKYEDPQSCILAVDNLIGVKILDRPLRIDHVENYRLPKHLEEKQLAAPGHAYEGQQLANQFTIEKGQDLFAPPADDDSSRERRKKKKAKKEQKKEARKREKHSRRKEKKNKRDSKRARLDEESHST